MSSDSQGKTTGFQLLLAWVFVGVPLAWGLYQTVLKAAPIFNWNTGYSFWSESFGKPYWPRYI